MKKKIIYVILLILLILAIVIFLINQDFEKNETIQNISKSISNKEVNVEEKKTDDKEQIDTYKTDLEDGKLYSLFNENIKSDIIIGDNYYDTQINDINLNPNIYADKNIEIEGMYLTNTPYTFVGRYSTSNLCQFCPAGYSYMEYTWDGESIDLQDEISWIKVVGTLEKMNDETTNYQDYYYIKAKTIEVMKESGIKTVNN